MMTLSEWVIATAAEHLLGFVNKTSMEDKTWYAAGEWCMVTQRKQTLGSYTGISAIVVQLTGDLKWWYDKRTWLFCSQ